MSIRITGADLRRLDLHTRMPFRFGIHTLGAVAHVFLRLDVSVDGQEVQGLAGEHLFPKWFSKKPAQPLDEETAELLLVLRQALAFGRAIEAESVFAWWRELYARQLAWGEAQGLEPLLALFGATIVERALIDAVARARGKPCHQLIRENDLGIDLGAVFPELAGREPADYLPPVPLSRIAARHTVGLTDKLRDAEIGDDERVDDGLPQSLEACIAAYGLRHFKIKVCAQGAGDLERLRGIAAVIHEAGLGDFAYSLDGNEQFTSCAQFRAFWQDVLADPGLAAFAEHCLFIEQPMSRTIALDDEMAPMRDWGDMPPVIIDESDAVIESLPRALELGYAGVSHKNCKGIIRGIINRCLLEHRQRSGALTRTVMSGEDLVNIGPVALLQDLAMQAALGNASVERNGHHYLAGLSAFSAATQAGVLEAHGDVYQTSPSGWPSLRVEQGMIAIDSLNRAPFGYAYDFPLDDYEPIALEEDALCLP